MRNAFAIITTIFTLFTFAAHAGVTPFNKREPVTQTATHLIEAFLNAPKNQSTIEIEDLHEALANLQGLPSEQLLVLIFNEAHTLLKTDLTYVQRARMESILRIRLTPSRNYDPSNTSDEIKQQAFALMKYFERSSPTRKALIAHIREFHLWIPEQYDWICEMVTEADGLSYAYPGIEALRSRFTDEQKLHLSDLVRAGSGSVYKLPALYQLGELSQDDVPVLLRIGAEMYRGATDPNQFMVSKLFLSNGSPAEERLAMIDALFGVRAQIRLNIADTLRLFEQERDRAQEVFSPFDKRAQFYRIFLQPHFEFPEVSHEAPAESKVIYANFTNPCSTSLKPTPKPVDQDSSSKTKL